MWRIAAGRRECQDAADASASHRASHVYACGQRVHVQTQAYARHVHKLTWKSVHVCTHGSCILCIFALHATARSCADSFIHARVTETQSTHHASSSPRLQDHPNPQSFDLRLKATRSRPPVDCSTSKHRLSDREFRFFILCVWFREMCSVYHGTGRILRVTNCSKLHFIGQRFENAGVCFWPMPLDT
jgi:hypothetical protein